MHGYFTFCAWRDERDAYQHYLRHLFHKGQGHGLSGYHYTETCSGAAANGNIEVIQ
jgi:hypothetical protein